MLYCIWYYYILASYNKYHYIISSLESLYNSSYYITHITTIHTGTNFGSYPAQFIISGIHVYTNHKRFSHSQRKSIWSAYSMFTLSLWIRYNGYKVQMLLRHCWVLLSMLQMSWGVNFSQEPSLDSSPIINWKSNTMWQLLYWDDVSWIQASIEMCSVWRAI